MFKRKFGYESTDYPTFDSLVRDDDMDIEVSCSGYGVTKEMENDLLLEYGVTDGQSDEDDDDDDDEDTENETETGTAFEGEADAAGKLQQHNESTSYSVNELAALRQQVDDEVKFANAKATAAAPKFDPIANFLQSVTNEMGNVRFDDGPTAEPIDDDFEDAFEDASDAMAVPLLVPVPVAAQLLAATTKTIATPQPQILTSNDSKANKSVDNDDNDSISGACSSVGSDDLQEAVDVVADLDTNSREYRIQMVKQMLEDTRSQRSHSTNASTIAPTVIKGRIRKTIELKAQADVRKRCLAKGEANATTRGRKENKDTVKEYAGWDF